MEKKRVEKKSSKKRSHRDRSEPSSSAARSASGSTSAGARSDTKRAKTKTDNRSTAAALFGSDSEDDHPAPADNEIGKKVSPLNSYVMRRVTNGYSRQANALKSGTHFIELKIYKCDEIENVSPMNRWRQAIVTIKNRTDVDTESWRHLSAYLTAIRKEFKDCPSMIINSYN